MSSTLQRQPDVGTLTKRHGWDAPVAIRLTLTVGLLFFMLASANPATPLYSALENTLHIGALASRSHSPATC